MAQNRQLDELMHPSWALALAPASSQIAALGEFLREETEGGRPYLPYGHSVFRAFSQPLGSVRVLIVGQDPYPTPGHAVGLSFSVDRKVAPVPRSLQNIYRELHDDLGVPVPDHGDLSDWAAHGVMMLNRVLTVRAGASGSHRGKGWEAVTDAAIRALVDRGGPLVAILWGRDAASLRPLLGSTPTITSAHPSPLSARNGFFGSRPFSSANKLLAEQGASAVDWSLG